MHDIKILFRNVLQTSTLWCLILCGLAVQEVCTGSVNVTSQLGRIDGVLREITLPDNSSHTLSVFLGIPYAKPPVGDLRFRKPIRLTSLGQHFRADIEGKACPQNPFILKAWVPGPADMSEDCLKLNVYVPGDITQNSTQFSENNSFPNNTKKPVMIWFHGGAYLIGQSRIYDGSRLATVGDVIVVTVNFRLGPLGFLSTGDGVVPGNLGLWDQHEAISWVHEHIAEFGGDPNKVTLFGESAGGASTLFQLLYPGNRGKIHRIISSSGTPLCPWAFHEQKPTKYAVRLAQNLGCGFDEYPGFSAIRHKKIIECLKSKTFEDIISNSSVGTIEETLFRAEWIPTVDGEFVKTSPKNIFPWPNFFSDSSTETARSINENIDNSFSLLPEVDAIVGTNYDDGETVAHITVQGFMKATTGLDLTSDSLDLDTVSTVYIPEMLRDYYGPAAVDTAMTDAIKYTYTNSTEYLFPSISDQKTPSGNESSTEPVQEILDVTTDYEFLMPAIRTISSMSVTTGPSYVQFSKSGTSTKRPTRYLYQFDRKYPYLSRSDWLHHAAHGDDLVYTFGFPSSMTEAFHITGSIEQQEWALAKAIMTYWTNFAKTGNPNTPSPVPVDWPQFDLTSQDYLYIAKNMRPENARNHLFVDRVRLWSKTLPQLYDKLSSLNAQSASAIVGR